MLSGCLQHQLLRTALEGHLRQGVAAHRLYRHHSALAESGVLHLVSLTELDQSQRLCEYDFSQGFIDMTWNVDPETLGLEDLYENYVAGELQ